MSKLPINKIRVRNRYRKNLGDIGPLAASIKELGLLHPIVIRPDGRLIAGERRLAACKQLGWKTVPVTRVDLNEVIRGEFAENAYRKDFLPSEIEAIRRALEPYEKAAAKERQRHHGGTAPGRRKRQSAKFSPTSGRVLDKIGAFAGISGRSLEKIRAVVNAAELNPKRFGSLVMEMDRSGRIDSVYRRFNPHPVPFLRMIETKKIVTLVGLGFNGLSRQPSSSYCSQMNGGGLRQLFDRGPPAFLVRSILDDAAFGTKLL